jgi:uncharacterized protein YndB with AHSA1/START domain
MPPATSQKALFSTECAVEIDIHASPEKIWELLTDVPNLTRWNSTLISVEGRIAPGETIKLKAKTAPDRVFNLKINHMTVPRLLVWEDGMAPMFKGVRTYTLTPRADGSTRFAMREVISGLMLPLIGGSLPDFKPSFDQYAADLKRAAEQG